MRKILFLSALLIFSVNSIAFGGASRPETAPVQRLGAGVEAPDFTLNNLKGQPVTLSQYRGKVVFLNFWATWCPPCRAEMPSMERLQEVFNGKDFVILAVNVEQYGEQSIKSFLEMSPYTFPILLDPDENLKIRYGVSAIPETFLINKKGIIVDRHLGTLDWSSVEMLKKISALINEG